MNISLNHQKLVVYLASIAAFLVFIHCVALAIYFYIDDPDVFGFVRLIDLDYEGNIPTLFSSLLFLINGGLLWLVYTGVKHSQQLYPRYWLGLAVIFIFLGFDEGSRMHEQVGDFLENFVQADGYLYFPWVIAYCTAFMLAVILYFRFYLSLDRALQIRLFLCAAVFLSGAVGVEILSAQQADTLGTSSLSYSILYTIEESLEMAGLILLVDTLLRKLRQDYGSLTFNLVNKAG